MKRLISLFLILMFSCQLALAMPKVINVWTIKEKYVTEFHGYTIALILENQKGERKLFKKRTSFGYNTDYFLYCVGDRVIFISENELEKLNKGVE